MMTFKLYGYKNEILPTTESIAIELKEITLVANSVELRKIANFLFQAAEGMELKGKDWEHEHLSDSQPEFINSPSFVVYNPLHDATTNKV